MHLIHLIIMYIITLRICYNLLNELVGILVIPSCRQFVAKPRVGIRYTESRPW